MTNLGLDTREALALCVAAGLTCHGIFKLTETRNLVLIFVLLFLAPAALGIFLNGARPGMLNILHSIVLSFCSYLGDLATSISLYRLSPFHPLASFPGPVACKLSKFYFAILCQEGKQHLYYQWLQRKYGDVVRVGPNELAFFTEDAIEPVFGANGLPKGPYWEGRIGETEMKSMIAIRDSNEHSQRRRIWQRAFVPSALQGYEALINARVNEFTDILATKAQPVDIAELLAYLTFDFTVDLAFGGGSTMMRDGDVDNVWSLIETSQKSSLFFTHVPWLGSLRLSLTRVLPSNIEVFRTFCKGRALVRRTQGPQYHDVFYHLIDEGGVLRTPPSVAQVVSDAALLVLAGSDTTSVVLASLFYHILTHPAVYLRLQQEIDKHCDQALNFKVQAEMPYLHAVINETMRLIPPVPDGSQRGTFDEKGGKVIAGRYVPPATVTIVPMYTLFHDQRYFSPRSDSFIPERWLEENERATLEPAIFGKHATEPYVHNRNVFIPFSYGPANCIGKTLAWMEMRMLVCSTLRRFELSLPEGFQAKTWESGLLNFQLMAKEELPVLVREKI